MNMDKQHKVSMPSIQLIQPTNVRKQLKYSNELIHSKPTNKYNIISYGTSNFSRFSLVGPINQSRNDQNFIKQR
jgi:hypothetical protein